MKPAEKENGEAEKTVNQFLAESDFSALFDSEKMIERLYRYLRKMFNADSLAFLAADAKEWQREFIFDFDPALLSNGLPLWAAAAVTKAYSDQKALYSLDAEQCEQPLLRDIFEKTGYRTVVFLPINTEVDLEDKLSTHNRAFQHIILNVNSFQADAFSEKELKLLLTGAHLVSNELMMSMLFTLASNYAKGIVENLPVGMFILTRQGAMLANDPARTILGLEEIALNHSLPLTRYFSNADEIGLSAAIERVYAHQSQLEELEFWYTRPDGRVVFLVAKITLLKMLQEGFRLLFSKAERRPEAIVILLEDTTDKHERQRLAREMELAHEVQMSLLPSQTPEAPGLEIATLSMPAMDVGGDYFDIIPLGGDRTGFIIADVSGKGIGAAFHMAELKGIFQTLARMMRSPKRMLMDANDVIYHNWDRSQFVSLAYAVIDIKWRMLELTRAGHEPVLLLREGQLLPLEPAGLALGLTKTADFAEKIEEMPYRLLKGDKLVFYTDGLTEATNPEQEAYGDERLRQLLLTIAEQPPKAIIQQVKEALHAFAGDGQQFDDVTMIVVEVL